MKRHRVRLATVCLQGLLCASLLLTWGCTSIKVVETWSNPARSGPRFHKVMVVGIGHDENLRRTAENVLVDELERNGVAAVASHTLVKEIDQAKRDDVVAAVRATGADAVLTIRPLAKGDARVSRSGQSEGIYGTATNVGGVNVPSAKSYSLATLQTNLYDTATAGLVWSATVSTYDAQNPVRVSRDLGRFFVERLRHDGLL